MQATRVWYEKTGTAKYISHLDVMRLMGRALKRSRLPVWYTEGFNPHIYMTFAQPLSLGVESLCEIMDIRLLEVIPPKQVKKSLNEVLPEGFSVVDVTEPEHKASEIAFSVYELRFSGQNIKKSFDTLMNGQTITVEKKSKRKVKEIDLKPLIEVVDIQSQGEELLLTLLLPSGQETNINPSLFAGALLEVAGEAALLESITKTKLFLSDKEKFK